MYLINEWNSYQNEIPFLWTILLGIFGVSIKRVKTTFTSINCLNLFLLVYGDYLLEQANKRNITKD